MENIGLGLALMGIGMVTVFAILLIVIYGSKLIIKIVNKVIRDEDGISPATRKVIEAAVVQLTASQGKISRITRVQ